VCSSKAPPERHLTAQSARDGAILSLYITESPIQVHLPFLSHWDNLVLGSSAWGMHYSRPWTYSITRPWIRIKLVVPTRPLACVTPTSGTYHNSIWGVNISTTRPWACNKLGHGVPATYVRATSTNWSRGASGSSPSCLDTEAASARTARVGGTFFHGGGSDTH